MSGKLQAGSGEQRPNGGGSPPVCRYDTQTSAMTLVLATWIDLYADVGG
jgi:hypothetical protein